MSTDPQLIDMGALRAKLLAAQEECREGGQRTTALEHVTDAIAMLNPRRDPDARHPSVSKDAVTQAMQAAHDALLAAGVQNPVEVLIVQSHDDAGQTTGRSLASSGANPQDLLRVCMNAIERNLRAGRDVRLKT